MRLVSLVVAFVILFLLLLGVPVFAQECEELPGDTEVQLNKKKDCFIEKLDQLKDQKATLNNQITRYDAQISLTELKIETTKEKIEQLGGRIGQLETSLTSLSKAFTSRAMETYKMARMADFAYLLISSPDLTTAVARFHYLQKIQEADQSLLVKLQRAQNIYQNEKDEQEDLEKELEEDKQVLGIQKVVKAELLRVTKNDEGRYQELLEQAKRELAALANSQFTGKKDVKRGDVIGLMGSTGFSTGPHLHFGYYSLTEEEHNGEFGGGIGWYSSRYTDPRSILQNRTLTSYDPSCPSPVGNGSFQWPLSNPYITQCYGVTPYSSVYEGNFHKGLDMSMKGTVSVSSIGDGIAYFYRGSTSFGNNVRIFHSNGKMSLYMHLR